ncbi:MAG: DNA primase [Nitrospirae bacterium]|nr:DNA primase [Nitrospirota bacterium]
MAKGFSDDVLQTIRERVDLVDLVESYVALKRTGQNAVGLCPFHTEKRPSFTVSASKQLFHCFGCGAGGDLFSFVMQRETISFPEAVQLLARKAGVALPERDAAGVDRRRQSLYDIHMAAADHFRDRLTSREGEAARRYLQGRRLTPESVDAFGLGYAASSWDDLSAALIAKGWTPSQLEEAGVVVPRTQGGGWYDRFRHRVMCPIRDVHRNVVAFGGRVLDDALPKYLNSPETPIFSKGRYLFGLDRARETVAATGTLVVVEGYFDVIATHQAGFANVVATLGTALTPAHLEVIRRLVTRVVLVFDPDAAGVRAALRTVDLFGPLDLRVDVVSLPGGKDPDRLIVEDGPDAFRSAVEAGRSLLAFVLEHLVPPGDYRTVDAKKAAAARALPVIAKIRNAIERDHYRAWVADRIQVADSTIRDALGRTRGDARRDGDGRRQAAPAHQPVRTSAPRPKAELVVAAALVQGRLDVSRVRALGAEAFTDPALRAVIDLVCSSVVSEGRVDASPASASKLWALAEGREDAARAIAELAVFVWSDDEADKEVDDCVTELEICRLKPRVIEVQRSIAEADANGEAERVAELQQELNRLMQATERLRGSRLVSVRAVGG